MRDTYSLGRIAGIGIGLHWSVLVLLGLLMWTLATAIFPDTNPGLGDGVYFTMAVVAALAFFASILLHELGHAVQARRDGMTIDGITLWLFGGVARFGGMFPSPGAEFRIAVAGPLVSLGLGAGFVGVAFLPGLPEPVNAVCAWLGFINLLLLAFNLLPALPLDGGRMLRAGLWRWKGDLRTATRLAAAGGRVISYALIGLGIAMLIFQGTFSGIWLAFIGWFLLQASAAESRAIMRREPRAELRVGDLMVRDPVTASPDQTLDDFLDRVAWSSRHTAYPVVEDGRALGIIPFRCLSDVPRDEWPRRRVADCMVARDALATLTADDDLGAAVAALRRSGLGRTLVLDGERLVGLLSISDVARAVA
ncbi:MAG TPA: site-2 protease family protein [Miltoncostaeaceae bacterium]|nr:site-2 protease family protein [Miltoncostaeaceae bacterium]